MPVLPDALELELSLQEHAAVGPAGPGSVSCRVELRVWDPRASDVPTPSSAVIRIDTTRL